MRTVSMVQYCSASRAGIATMKVCHFVADEARLWNGARCTFNRRMCIMSMLMACTPKSRSPRQTSFQLRRTCHLWPNSVHLAGLFVVGNKQQTFVNVWDLCRPYHMIQMIGVPLYFRATSVPWELSQRKLRCMFNERIVLWYLCILTTYHDIVLDPFFEGLPNHPMRICQQ